MERCENSLKHKKWHLIIIVVMVLASALLYTMHYAIFLDIHHIFIYLIGDIAFLPLEVLIVTLVLERVFSEREKRIMLKKLNMAIGTFFSEIGIPLLKKLSEADNDTEKIRDSLLVNGDWTKKSFARVKNQIMEFNFMVEINPEQLEDLKEYFLGKREFMLHLLENPNLLEHDAFTNLLWAVFHLSEELAARRNLQNLNELDYKHLIIDIQRAYRLLTLEWLSYMQHLLMDYPYLFSFAIRTNPFDPKASPELGS